MKTASKHKICRAVIGATWSIPVRYVTLGAQLAAIAQIAQINLQLDTHIAAAAMTAGVAVGWSLRVLDNLLNEFVVFEQVKRFFSGRSNGL